MTKKELATVLAALRHWQQMEEQSPALTFHPGDDRSGTHFEHHDPLTVQEIDVLCDRLNLKTE